MSVLSAEAIAGYAAAAGFQGSDLTTAVAVAFAESGGNPESVNRANRNGSVDYGLWQINTVHSDLLNGGSWSDPASNARMAYTLYKARGGFRDWAAYNNGSYLAYMPKASVATRTPVKVSSPTPGKAGTSNGFTSDLSRAGFGLAGCVLILIAVTDADKLRAAVAFAVTKGKVK